MGETPPIEEEYHRTKTNLAPALLAVWALGIGKGNRQKAYDARMEEPAMGVAYRVLPVPQVSSE